MKFVKGLVIGGVVCASVAMVYADGMYMNKRKIMKNGRKLAKKIGII